MIPGAAPIIGGVALPDCVWQQHASSTASTNTYTLSGIAIGNGSANYVIVAVYLFSAFPANSPPGSLTVGGNAATIPVNKAGGSLDNLSIWIAPAPAGTTANIVITDSAGGRGVQIEVWAAYRLRSPSAIGTISQGTASPVSGSLTTSSGGIIVAAASGLTTQTYSFSGVSSNDSGFASSGVSMGAGSTTKTAAGTPTVSATPNTSVAYLVAASFR